MPKTNLGKWSLGLIIAMPILFAIGMSFTNTLYESVSGGGTILKDIANRPALAITMLVGIIAGISAFITGIFAIFKRKERAFLAYASTIIGALFTIYMIAEVSFPH